MFVKMFEVSESNERMVSILILLFYCINNSENWIVATEGSYQYPRF